MQLGPLQQAWVESLETHPERQLATRLGALQFNGSYKACCLGELLICSRRLQNPELDVKTLFNTWGDLVDSSTDDCNDDSTGFLVSSYKIYGLVDLRGSFVCGSRTLTKNNGEKYSKVTSLANLNDWGWTWPEIAAIVRKNPEWVFIKSV